ncbi:hypothetical protein [Caulobacter sp. NIBR2454]|uniref:hypothetical protein n=1 Tax=Caulobacter sp. NIBR2454 TaxID=3015996 RepID=UPI0022B7483C|nr:hypothetical protein [Caulobacter sp. NIBR2454]
MRVVVDNSPEDLARREASDRFEQALVSLTANLIRVARGAGQGYEVPRQTAELVRALSAYWDAFGHYPPTDTYNTVLNWEKPYNPDLPDGEGLRESGLEAITRGSLQIVASRLLGQHLQIAAGESQVAAGMRFVEEGREISRKAWAAKRAAAAPKAKVIKKKRGGPPKPSW